MDTKTDPRTVEATRHPAESYVHPPRVPPSPADHVFGPDHMVHFYDVPGEALTYEELGPNPLLDEPVSAS